MPALFPILSHPQFASTSHWEIRSGEQMNGLRTRIHAAGQDPKRATGASIIGLHSRSGNYFVPTSEALALRRDSQPVWWCHGEAAIQQALDDILVSGRLPM